MRRSPFPWLLFLSLALAAPAMAGPAYQVIDLGANVRPFGLDEAGVPFGQCGGQACLIPPGQPPVLLGFLANGNQSTARGREGALGTVGESGIDAISSQTHAYVRYAGRVRDLGAPDGAQPFSTARDLVLRSVVGWGEGDAGQSQALVWPRPGPGFRVLPTLGGIGVGFADALIPGVVVGQSDTVDRELHATMWVMGFPQDLTPGDGILSQANAITRVGGVVVVVGQKNNHAWFWTAVVGGVDVPLRSDELASTLVSVNNAGIAVGAHRLAGLETLSVRGVRMNGGVLQDLNGLVHAPQWVFEDATGINNAGLIVGIGHFQGQPRGYLLRPLP